MLLLLLCLRSLCSVWSVIIWREERMLSALVICTPSSPNLSGAAVLLLWGPAGCAREITALLNPSDCLSDVSGSDTGSTKFYHSTAGGSQGDPLFASLPPPQHPTYQFLTSHIHVTLHFPICSWEPGLESEFLGFFHATEMGPEMEQRRKEAPERKEGGGQKSPAVEDASRITQVNQTGKWRNWGTKRESGLCISSCVARGGV